MLVARRLLGLAVAALLVTACEDAPMGPEGGVAGNWSIQAFEDATNCGEGTDSYSLSVRIEQSTDNTLTVTIDGTDYTGMLNGSTGTWSGSYDEDGGTTTEQYTVTFSNMNSSLSGGSTWTWSDGASSCSGTVTVTGTRQ